MYLCATSLVCPWHTSVLLVGLPLVYFYATSLVYLWHTSVLLGYLPLVCPCAPPLGRLFEFLESKDISTPVIHHLIFPAGIAK